MDFPYPRVGVRTSEESHVREPGKPEVIDKGSAPLQQARGIGPRHALADVAAVKLGTWGVEG
jgi:hypothetical protein